MFPRELTAAPSDVELEELARDGAIALRRVLDRSYFFYDQLLVKEPGTAEKTPLHHDLP
jgi:hypothetical protein